MSQRLWITYLMCWIAGLACGSVASVVPTYLPTIAERLVGDSVGPQAAELGSTVQSMFLFGWVLGGIALGLVADLRGRVPVLGVALVGACLLTGLTPYVSSPLVFGGVRLLTGMCVGAIMVVSSTLGVEILPEKRRPLLMGILANSYAVGIVCSGALQSRALSYETVVTLFMLFSAPALVFFTPLVERSQDATVTQRQGTIASQLSQSKREIAIGATLFGCMLITLWAAFSWLPTWASDLFPGTDGGAGVRGCTMMALGGGGIIGSLLVAPVVHFGANFVDVKTPNPFLPSGDKILSPNTSPNRLNLSATYTVPMSWDASVMCRYVDGFTWLAGDFQGYVPSFTVVNLNAGLYVTNDLRLGLAINNLLDRRYYEVYGGTILPRLTYLSATYDF